MQVERTMLRFDEGNHRFNFRSASVLIENGYVLLHQVVGDDFWALPGGRVEFFEFSNDTAIRELVEELDFETDVVRPLWFVENFFTFGDRAFHEIGHYFLTKLRNGKPLDFDREFEGVEKSVNLTFKWFRIDGLEDIDLRPTFLKVGLSDMPEQPCHITINELNA